MGLSLPMQLFKSMAAMMKKHGVALVTSELFKS